MATLHRTPNDMQIPVRNLRFSHDAATHPRWWHGGDPVPTAFFNALSCTFPLGEKFFMDSVRAFRGRTPEPLASQIGDFLAQEAVHSREHMAFNKAAADAGYDIAALEARIKRRLDFARTRSAEEQLAATCALEHFTAILAHALLANKGLDMNGAPEEARRLWTWHAMEEIEHKAVAFDTYLHVTRGWSALRRYRIRIRAMIVATLILYSTVGANMRDLYRADGISNRRIWGKTLKYLFVHPGSLRRIFPAYLTYFKPRFHPWQHDDRALLPAVHAQFGAAAA